MIDVESMVGDGKQPAPVHNKADGMQNPKQRSSCQTKIKAMRKKRASRLQLKRAQSYLGLLHDSIPVSSSVSCPENPLGNGSFAETGHGNPLGFEASEGDPSCYAFFVAIDLEAFEFNKNTVTEIGVSTLDTRSLIGMDPGSAGKKWATKIKSCHFRILENAEMLNTVSLDGCPDKFAYGKTEWIEEKTAISVLHQCFHPKGPAYEDSSNLTRRVIFVAHNAYADQVYLANLGFDLTPEAMDVLDTQEISKAVFREQSSISLSKLLRRLNIDEIYAHNAGNDANHTMRALLALALKNFDGKASARYWETEREKRIEAAMELARIKAIEEIEGWSTAEDEDLEVIMSSVNAPYKPRSAKIQAQIKLHAEEAKAQARRDADGFVDADDAESVKREARLEVWLSRGLRAGGSTTQADSSTGLEAVMAPPTQGGDGTTRFPKGRSNRLRYLQKL